ncbi:actin cortical patch protein Sur7, putative [Talaromyces stipitatus ATCC 10500]|uniref:Actin cortical patch protein Sur7, putative n=1 Tax=Talaromyces stipitatus (strain ATCC 10500 / CBS 375.48 / QM 6759 / NRRL 1006) TaxID=441959 RepID=B8M6Y0_TALSN|nr:actin cortical patch protein Sur7, putative [Talaromyces stipitatus ATCC 10500]EED20200.1 actin cortical patch protein Sur7, putative [Talaromyces stipitatus ATCC 10500]
MAAGRPILGFLALFFVAGALLLMFLTFLGGVNNHVPLNDIYFLQADTSRIPGAPSTSRWTFWNVCPVSDGKSQCGDVHPDFPFDPPSSLNFGTTENVPLEFIGTRHYFLMSRFMFPFMLIALFFATLSLFLGLLALCTRIGSYLSSLLAWIAWVFQVITASLMTACFVQGRDHFNSFGESARLGRKAFGFMWAAVACLTLSTVLYCMGGAAGRSSSSGYSGRETRRRGFFASRRSSTRSRGSFRSKREDAV